jgi:hypothetical protein
MTTKKKTAGLLDKLETSLTSLIADMDKKGNTEAYTLTDRMKVYDRVLKLEALKQGIGDKDDGAGFKDED